MEDEKLIVKEEKDLQKLYGAEVGKQIFNRSQKVQYMRETLSDLAELILAPMLAILSYFFLYQGTAPNIYTISIVSFTVGLVTKDFVERLEDYASKFATSLGKESGQKADEESDKVSTTEDCTGTAATASGAPIRS